MGALVDRIKAEAADANEEGFCVVPEGVLTEAAAHIERLEEDLRNTRRERDEWHGRAAESVRLRRERDEFAADARRYRWLRERINFDDVIEESNGIVQSYRSWEHRDYRGQPPERESIDEYIDAALSAQRGGE
jgi:hypothetical protein